MSSLLGKCQHQTMSPQHPSIPGQRVTVHVQSSVLCQCSVRLKISIRLRGLARSACNFILRGRSQMTSAFFGVSDTPWCLCQPIISFWHAPWCFKLMTSFVNHPEPKMIIFRIQFISIRFNRICVTYYMAMEKSQSLLQKGSSSA